MLETRSVKLVLLALALPLVASANDVIGTIRVEGWIATTSATTSTVCPEKQGNERVTAGVGGALAGVVVWVEGVKGSAPPSRVDVRLDGCAFSPRVSAVGAGSTLSIVNGAPKHLLVAAKTGPVTAFTWALPLQDRPRERVVGVPGLLEISAEIGPPAARAFVHVFDHPFFAVTGSDGTFRLGGLPDGRWTLVAWHELFGTQRVDLAVAGNTTRDLVFKHP